MRRVILLGVILAGMLITPARAFDHGFDPASPVTRWFDALIRPDFPGSHCCGKSDAYAVEIIKDGGSSSNWTARVTDGSAIVFPDGTSRDPIANGTIIEVQPEKVTKPSQDNPTKTAWVFMYVKRGNMEMVYCLVPMPPGM